MRAIVSEDDPEGALALLRGSVHVLDGLLAKCDCNAVWDIVLGPNQLARVHVEHLDLNSVTEELSVPFEFVYLPEALL